MEHKKGRLEDLTDEEVEKIRKDIVEYLRPESKLKAKEIVERNNIKQYVFNRILQKVIGIQTLNK